MCLLPKDLGRGTSPPRDVGKRVRDYVNIMAAALALHFRYLGCDLHRCSRDYVNGFVNILAANVVLHFFSVALHQLFC